jgi:pimeloyl-ACP methyl ester carboxylesterase
MTPRSLRIGIAMIILPFLSGCLGFMDPPDDAQLRKEFAPYPAPISRFANTGDDSIHYMETESESKTTVIIVHGSPGFWHNFSRFMRDERLRERFHMISVDRPGYGQSNPGISEPSMKAQAEAILGVLSALPEDQKVILVGHSLGGPIIAEMALLQPSRIHGLLFIGASMDPELEETKWIQYPANWPLLRNLIPSVLRVCNEEILPLKPQLIELQKMLPEISQYSIVIQGGRDTLVPPGNAVFLMKHLPQTKALLKEYPELNHFIPFEQPEIIVDAIIQLDAMIND